MTDPIEDQDDEADMASDAEAEAGVKAKQTVSRSITSK